MEFLDTLRECLPGWTLAIALLGEGVMGFIEPERRIIWVDVNLPRRELASTVMHEIVHALRGDTSDDPAAEQAVEIETAARLIPERALIRALARSTHPEDVADILDVDMDVFLTRMRNLSHDETGLIRGLLATASPRDPASRHCAISRWWAHHGLAGQYLRQEPPAQSTARVLQFRTTVVPDAVGAGSGSGVA